MATTVEMRRELDHDPHTLCEAEPSSNGLASDMFTRGDSENAVAPREAQHVIGVANGSKGIEEPFRIGGAYLHWVPDQIVALDRRCPWDENVTERQGSRAKNHPRELRELFGPSR